MRSIGVFAKWPIPGRVKTRLVPALPAALAARLQIALIGDTLEAVAHAAADRRILFLADAPEVPPGAGGEPIWVRLHETCEAPEPPPPWISRFEARAQAGADLGERLGRAFAELLRPPGERAVVVGSDAPDLDATCIDQAFQALERTDLALGPAGDGGYFLIGLARSHPELFEGIPWSTEHALSATLAIARSRNLKATLLRPLDDVDTPADLVRWAARCIADPRASRAVQTLRSFRLLPGAPPAPGA